MFLVLMTRRGNILAIADAMQWLFGLFCHYHSSLDIELAIDDILLCPNSTHILLNYRDIQMCFRMETQKDNIRYGI
jgi:hypothetical protein